MGIAFEAGRECPASFAPPILHAKIVAPAHSKAAPMAIHVLSPTRVRFAVAVLSAASAFHAVAQTASPEPDKVSLSESTITWSTVKYATSADNGFITGSLDKQTIVDRTLTT